MTAHNPQSRRRILIFWMAVALVGGVCSLVLPPYFVAGGLVQPAYGRPLIPWFAIAWANISLTATMVCYYLLGFTVGAAQPKSWRPLALATVAASPALIAAHILHDWTHDPTSHNLFPFEFLIYTFIALPGPIGAYCGSLFRRFLPPFTARRPGSRHERKD